MKLNMNYLLVSCLEDEPKKNKIVMEIENGVESDKKNINSMN